MDVGGGRKAYNEINITPMVDLTFVLLVIFIIMTTASVQGIKVDLPKASSAVNLAKPKTIAITVNDQGQVFMDAYPVTLAELEARLRTEKATNPEVPIVLKGDQVVQYGKVTEVLDLLRKLELNKVGLATGKSN
ncbi:biopolymer transport protein ExbD [Sphingobium fontiphilum]|uniref:Biopolymer transport protein ExbD n=1 Tax=Sphingobium fontiphilum TaxID=944425 RepID=A0A7W6DBZ2_9SPHN|nr:biopolymer transporter ExbD [Sphingobium fontiphilum]MBB3980451.1 biopolymer transport protein ExbD [Sphingobium fontiphilum]